MICTIRDLVLQHEGLTLSGLFTCRMNCQIVNPIDSFHDTLDGRSALSQTQIFMPRTGFEPTIPILERVKALRALDRAVSVIGMHK
jgi:hypothetical protein